MEGTINEQLLARLKQEIQAQYVQKYGAVSIEFDELVPVDELTVRVTFTIQRHMPLFSCFSFSGSHPRQQAHEHLIELGRIDGLQHVFAQRNEQSSTGYHCTHW